MGTSKNRRDRFLREHPLCAFCGGTQSTETEEHCPPRSMFQNAQWPEGFVFPACFKCNNGTGKFDEIFALCARMDPFFDSGNADGQGDDLIASLVQKYPGLARQVLMGPCEARRYNRLHGLRPGPGQFHNETGIVRFPTLFVEAVKVVSLKLTKAIFYQQRKSIFPNAGCVVGDFSTNADLVRTGSYPIIEHFMKLGGISKPARRSGIELSEQFQWKFTPLDDAEHFLVQATFGRAFAVLTIANPHEGKLEAVIEMLRQRSGGPGPFAVLQSRLIG